MCCNSRFVQRVLLGIIGVGLPILQLFDLSWMVVVIDPKFDKDQNQNADQQKRTKNTAKDNQ